MVRACVKRPFEPSTSLSDRRDYHPTMARAPAPGRPALLLAVAFLVVTAGCSAIGATPTTDSPNGARETAPGEFPPSPEELTASSAARTAAQYHLATFAERLEPERPDGTSSIPGLEAVAATAVERRSGGYYVIVDLTTPESAQDLAPVLDRAVYLVRENATPRPAMPVYVAGDGDLGTGGGAALQVTNFDRDRANVSIVVTNIEDTPSTTMVRTPVVHADEGLLVTEAIPEPGTYRVTAATGNASQSRTVTLDGSAVTDSIGVFVAPDGQVEIYPIQAAGSADG